MLNKLLILSLLSSGVALAETAPNLPDREPIPMRVRDLAKEAGRDVVDNMGTSKPRNISGTSFQKVLPKAGKYIRYGGNFLFAASLINDALQWFYDEAQRSANPALDDWWNDSVGEFVTPPAIYKLPWGVDVNYTGQRCFSNTGGTQVFLYNGPVDPTIIMYRNGQFERSGTYNTFAEAQESFRQSCGPEAQTLRELADTYPEVIQPLGQIMADYVNAHPDAIRTSLGPIPNENQWGDNPYADPLIDTDGDGVTDSKEFESPDGDANNPLVTPRTPGETSVITTTTRNPDGSVTRRTVTTRTDGSKKIVEVTTKKDVTKNPDGSTTTKTTTTTTTSELNPDGSNKQGYPKTETKKEEETSLAPEEEPAPPTEEAPCKAAGGTWDIEGGTCAMPKKDEALPDQSDFAQPDPFKLPDLTKLKENFDKNATDLIFKAKTKLPFGIATKWFPKPDSVASDCPSWPMDIGPLKMTYDPCATKIAQDAHYIMRPVLSGILMLMFGFMAARIVGAA